MKNYTEEPRLKMRNTLRNEEEPVRGTRSLKRNFMLGLINELDSLLKVLIVVHFLFYNALLFMFMWSTSSADMMRSYFQLFSVEKAFCEQSPSCKHWWAMRSCSRQPKLFADPKYYDTNKWYSWLCQRALTSLQDAKAQPSSKVKLLIFQKSLQPTSSMRVIKSPWVQKYGNVHGPRVKVWF